MILALQATVGARHDSPELPSTTILNQYAYLLLDASRVGDERGGTGRLSDWSLAKKLALDYRLILAGGLNPDNIIAAIETVRPYAVDVASGLETSPGIKDPFLVKKFLEGCHHGA